MLGVVGALPCQHTKTMKNGGERVQQKHKPQQFNSTIQNLSGRCCLLQRLMNGLHAMPRRANMAKSDLFCVKLWAFNKWGTCPRG